MLKKSIRWEAIWDFRCIKTKTGELVWDDLGRKNSLAQEGGYLILDDVLRGDAGAAQFYVRLYNDTPVKTDTLSIIGGEPSTNGYAAQLLEKSAVGWPTLAIDGTDYQATSKEVTFSASGGSWGPVFYGVLATTSDNTGKLFAFVALSQNRTINNEESVLVTIKVKQS